MYRLSRLLFFLLSFFSCQFLQAQSPFYYPANQHTLALEQEITLTVLPQHLLQYYLDSKQETTFPKIASPAYRKLFQSTVSWEASSTLWVKFSLFNRSNQDSTWMLNLGAIDSATLFFHRENGQYDQTSVGLHKRAFYIQQHYQFNSTVPIKLPKNEALTIYIAIQQQSLPYPTLTWSIQPLSLYQENNQAFLYWQQRLWYISLALACLTCVLLLFQQKIALLPFILGSGGFLLYCYSFSQHSYSFSQQLLGSTALAQFTWIALVGFFLALLHSSRGVIGIYLSLRIAILVLISYYTFSGDMIPFHRDWFTWAMLGTILLDQSFLFVVIYRAKTPFKGLLYLMILSLFLPWFWYFSGMLYGSYVIEIGLSISMIFTSCYLLLGLRLSYKENIRSK